MNFGIKIKYLRKEKKISQEELGRRFEVTKQTVSNWENGVSTPSYETLIGLAELFSVDINFLLDYKPKYSRRVGESEKASSIPVYDLQNFKSEIEDSMIIHHEPVPESYINDGDYMVIKMNDDSMIGERIFRGSKLIVKKQKIFTSGDIVLVRHYEDFEEKFMIRKIKAVTDKIVLFPANYEYLQEDYTDKKMSIYGVIKYIGFQEIINLEMDNQAQNRLADVLSRGMKLPICHDNPEKSKNIEDKW